MPEPAEWSYVFAEVEWVIPDTSVLQPSPLRSFRRTSSNADPAIQSASI